MRTGRDIRNRSLLNQKAMLIKKVVHLCHQILLKFPSKRLSHWLAEEVSSFIRVSHMYPLKSCYKLHLLILDRDFHQNWTRSWNIFLRLWKMKGFNRCWSISQIIVLSILIFMRQRPPQMPIKLTWLTWTSILASLSLLAWNLYSQL